MMGALFMALTETGGECQPMPSIDGHYMDGSAEQGNPKFLYNLTIADAERDKSRVLYNITGLSAFCLGNCSDANCQIVRAEPTHNGTSDAVVEFNECYPVSVEKPYSFFVRDGQPGTALGCDDDKVQPEVCMLEHHEEDSRNALTELKYHRGSGCSHCNSKGDQGYAVLAMTLREPGGPDDCDSNPFDNTNYLLNLNPSGNITGTVGCDKALINKIGCAGDGCRCPNVGCENFSAPYGQCGGIDPSKPGQAGNVRLVQTALNGAMENKKPKWEENQKQIGLCSGLPPRPIPNPTPGPKPTAPPTKDTGKKHEYRMTVIIMAAVLAGFAISYLIFVVLRRRKLRRMSAYAALQDDPTF